jgi:hypothetical protein
LTDTQYEGLFTRQSERIGKAFVICFRVNGKNRYKSVGYEGDRFGMTAKRVFVIKEKLREKAYHGDIRIPIEIRAFEKVFERYIENVRPLQSAKHIAIKCYACGKHILPYTFNQQITSLDTAFWQIIINRMLTSGLAPSTAGKMKKIIKKTYDYAISCKIATENPSTGIIIPKYDDEVEIDLTDAETKRLYDIIR